MDLDWVRSIRDQCTAAGVAFFYKQQGSADGGPKHRRELDGREWSEYPEGVMV
jgi:protein gp37